MASALNVFLLTYAQLPDTAALVPAGVYIGVGAIAATFAAGVVFVNNLPIERVVSTITETPEGKVTETVTEKPTAPL